MRKNINALTFFSANISKLLPAVPLRDHQALFAEAGNVQRLVMDDRLNERWLAELPDDHRLQTIKQRSGVIASFHTGAYRLLPMWLISRGIPLTLLVTADVATSQAERYRAIVGRMPGGGIPLEVCCAEDPMVLRKLARAMAQGRCIMAFLDGNESAGAKTAPSKRAEAVIDFLAHRLRVKTGIAELAYLTGRPIYPMTMAFDGTGTPRPDVLPPIVYSKSDKRQAFVQTAMSRLYGVLADTVARHPAQWEGWFYVHHDLVLDRPIADEAFIRQYMPFSIGERYFLLHRNTYSVYSLSGALFDKMCAFYLNEPRK